jgi:hypothetical protein
MTTHEQVWNTFGPRVIWYPKQTKFFYNASTVREHWIDPGTEKHLLNHLKLGGFYDGIVRSEDPALRDVADKIFKEEIAERRDKFLARVQTGNTVQWVGELGGRVAGLHRVGNRQILLLHGPTFPTPAEGDCSFGLKILEELLPGDQAPRFLAWLKRAYLAIKNQSGEMGQALIVAGASDSGKSLLQKRFITPVLGDQGADAIRFLIGQTGFNGELGAASHWMVDDQGDAVGFNRQVFSDAVKKAVADPMTRIEAKGADAITAPIFRRLSIVMNTGGKNMALLPELTEDIADKLIVLKCDKVTSLLGSTPENNARLVADLPAFLYWLEGYEPDPEVMGNPRFGTQAYFHPELKRELQSTSAAANLLPLIKKLSTRFEGVYEGTSQQIYDELLQSPSRFFLEKIVKSIQQFGRLMTEITKLYPELVTKRETKHGARYRIVVTDEKPEIKTTVVG